MNYSIKLRKVNHEKPKSHLYLIQKLFQIPAEIIKKKYFSFFIILVLVRKRKIYCDENVLSYFNILGNVISSKY